jgi:hypothetical protein
MAEISQKPKRRKGMGEPPKSVDAKPDNLLKPASTETVALNFHVDPEFKKEFKLYAVEHKPSMLQLLRDCFDFYKKHHP